MITKESGSLRSFSWRYQFPFRSILYRTEPLNHPNKTASGLRNSTNHSFQEQAIAVLREELLEWTCFNRFEDTLMDRNDEFDSRVFQICFSVKRQTEASAELLGLKGLPQLQDFFLLDHRQRLDSSHNGFQMLPLIFCCSSSAALRSSHRCRAIARQTAPTKQLTLNPGIQKRLCVGRVRKIAKDLARVLT